MPKHFPTPLRYFFGTCILSFHILALYDVAADQDPGLVAMSDDQMKQSRATDEDELSGALICLSLDNYWSMTGCSIILEKKLLRHSLLVSR